MVQHILSSEASSESDDNFSDRHDEQDICRDYLRNVCKRGRHCKYRHPSTMDDTNFDKFVKLSFCHDYQNSGCRRDSCKFIHCTRDEEDIYKETNQLPDHVMHSSSILALVNPNLCLTDGEVPICRDFLKGDCKRNSKCKYRHYSNLHFENTSKDSDKISNPKKSYYSNYDPNVDYCDFTNEDNFCSYILPHKRQCIEVQDIGNSLNTAPTFKFPSPVDYNLLQEENNLLIQKVKELEKQVSDLYATNEVLLDQNARLRVSRSNLIAHQHPPIVTVSQVVTPTVTSSVSIKRPTLSGTVAVLNTTLPSMNAITITNSDMMVNASSLPTMCTRIAQEIPSHCSTLNTSVPVNAQTLIPVSINVETLSGTLQHNMSQSYNPTVGNCNYSQDRITEPSSQMVSYPILSSNQIGVSRL